MGLQSSGWIVPEEEILEPLGKHAKTGQEPDLFECLPEWDLQLNQNRGEEGTLIP